MSVAASERLQQDGRSCRQIAHEPRQFRIRASFDQPRDRPLIADLVIEALAQQQRPENVNAE